MILQVTCQFFDPEKALINTKDRIYFLSKIDTKKEVNFLYKITKTYTSH